jgi:Protein of unknown function (DUF2917)
MHALSQSIMNRLGYTRTKRLSLRPLGQNEPLALGARRGTVVACLSGELWVTHAGDPRDYIVPRGYRYCASADGLIVVNSLRGLSQALVYWTNPERCADFTRNDVHIDHHSMQRLMQQAQILRNKAMDRVARRLRRSLVHRWRALAKRLECLSP